MTDDLLDDDQRQLVDSARRYIERGYRRGGDGQWHAFGELGWLAMPVAETDGGIGASTLDICLLAEALGQGVVDEPFVASAVLAGGVLAAADEGHAKAQWLPSLIDGSRRIAFASSTGPVVGGARADAWIIERDGGLLLIEAGAPGAQATACKLYDGRDAARLQLGDARGVRLVAANTPAVEAAKARALLAHCAESVGTMQRAFDITLDYLKMRKQFGRSIASNQIVQHRLVDLLVEIEEARALTRAAALSPTPRPVAAAKAFVSRASRAVWKEAVQLHGAIGMTEECEVGACVKRLAVAATLYGDEVPHLETLARLSLEGAAA